MTPQARQTGATDTASPAQGRFTVQLPGELGPVVDQVGEKMQAAMQEQLGFAPDLSRAAIVTGLIKSAVKAQENGATETKES